MRGDVVHLGRYTGHGIDLFGGDGDKMAVESQINRPGLREILLWGKMRRRLDSVRGAALEALVVVMRS